ncbi:class I adenylate-forming enzyme family protein [Burkholderia ambifaria]|uniref:class I adenylate-forming enzyme family protein n=1 Tax=Burkholderia ambifaria TaxID=152480 RepID=UPI00158D36FF|nr:class I adenylate-forming enzyme family protein [Burkholderia ambifaria]MBR8343527.1 acyl--CoA ligase [Burkholderia ambifaria]
MVNITTLDGFLTHLEGSSRGRLIDTWGGEREGARYSRLVDVASAWECHFASLGMPAGLPLILPMRIRVASFAAFLGALRCGFFPILIKPALPVNLVHEMLKQIGGGLVLASATTSAVFEAHEYLASGNQIGDSQVLRTPDVASPVPGHEKGLVGILSSGSTGMPKVIVHPFSNLLRNASMHSNAIDIVADDTVLLNLPLNYSYGLVAGLLATLLAEATGILVDQQRVNLRGALKGFHVTTCMSTPAHVLANFPDNLLGRLRRLTVGGDVLRASLALQLIDVVKNGKVFATYGLTEAGPRVATQMLETACISRYQAVPLGAPLEGVKLSLCANEADDAGRELLVDTPTVMHGYLGDEEGTSAVLCKPGGKLRTGDMFYQRDDLLFFAGRRKRIIVRGGENIYPALVEGVLMRFPDIEDAWVTAETHDDLGQVPVAYLIAQRAIDVGSLARELRRYLPTSHIPMRWEQVHAFPGTARK